MADEKKPAAAAAKVTILNQKEGKLVLPPDPEELKKNPKAEPRVLVSGGTLEVSADEAAKLLNHRGLVDASKAMPSVGAREAELKKQIADLKAENAKLKGDGKGDDKSGKGKGDKA